MQKSFLFWSLFPSEYQLPIAPRASGPAAEERRRREKGDCPGSVQVSAWESPEGGGG